MISPPSRGCSMFTPYVYECCDVGPMLRILLGRGVAACAHTAIYSQLRFSLLLLISSLSCSTDLARLLSPLRHLSRVSYLVLSHWACISHALPRSASPSLPRSSKPTQAHQAPITTLHAKLNSALKWHKPFQQRPHKRVRQLVERFSHSHNCHSAVMRCSAGDKSSSATMWMVLPRRLSIVSDFAVASCSVPKLVVKCA